MRKKLEIIKQLPGNDTGKRPVLFVHGAWHGAWCWDKYFLPYFARSGYPAYALSLSHHGKSEGRKKFNFTYISDYVKDLAEVVDTFEDKPFIVAHSMGGLVLQKYLEIASIPGAVLLASIPPAGVLRITLHLARNHFKEFLIANLTWNLYKLVGTEKLTKRMFFSADMEAEKVAEYFKALKNESYLAFLTGMIFPRIKHKKQARVPMLVLGAEDDYIISKKEVETTAKKYAAQLKVFPGMAHDMMLEPGWQEVADAIIEWLDKL
jgi:pimeloyl-ACP methyl ester carboxylesterase